VISGTVYANGLTFDAAAAVTNGTLNLAGTTPTFTVNGTGSSATITSALSGTDFRKAGTGTLILTGASSVGLTNMSGGGTLVLSGGGSMTNATSGATLYIGNINNNNTVLVTGNNSLWNLNGNTLRLGDVSSNNTLTVSSSGIVSNIGTLYVGISAGGLTVANNSLIITNGGKLYTTQGNISTQNSPNNRVLVTGDNSLWSNDTLTIGGNPGNYPGHLTIEQGGVVTNRALTVFGGSIVVTNRGTLVLSGNTVLNNTSWTSGRSSVTIGTNSLWNAGGNRVFIGGTSNIITVADGGVWTNAYFGINNGLGGSLYNLIITNGGKAYLGASSTATTISGRDGGSSNTVVVTGANSLLDNGGAAFYVGFNANNTYVHNFNTLLIASGGMANKISTLYVGNFSNHVGNVSVVTSGGLLEITTGITVGRSATATSASNSVTVSGGVLQFTTAAPTITINNTGDSGNAMTLTNAIISFRAVTNATVLCSKSGNQLTNALWLGENTFRLNAATNAAGNQDYTFANTLGATNFAALSLHNGASWRGGTATIGAGGSLEVGTGTNYITDLTFTSGGAMDITFNGPSDFSRLNVSGALTLGGATLNLTLNAAPERNVEYQILSGTVSDTFGNSSVTANCAGTDYVMAVKHSATGVSIVNQRSRGTVISIR
jgi:T5SS/PEP-CTERM-associated repeat protein